MPHTKYKLIYFDARSRGEIARQLFALAGVEFEDFRFKWPEWPEVKKKTPFGHVPVLEVDGQQLAQSNAINRYLARKFGYAGNTPFEEALVDSIVDQYEDYYNEIIPWFWTLAGWEKNDLEKTYQTAAIPGRDKFYPFVRNFLAKSGSGYLVGSSLTYADLAIAEHVSQVNKAAPEFLKDYPEVGLARKGGQKFQVLAHSAKITAYPRLEKYLAARSPDDDF